MLIFNSLYNAYNSSYEIEYVVERHCDVNVRDFQKKLQVRMKSEWWSDRWQSGKEALTNHLIDAYTFTANTVVLKTSIMFWKHKFPHNSHS